MYKHILTAIIIFTQPLLADDLKCVSGQPSSTNLVEQLTNAKANNSLTKLIYEKYKLGVKTEANAPCSECGGSLNKLPEGLKEVRSTTLHSPEPPTLAFKQECLEVSNTSSSSSAPQISCPSGNQGKGNMCITSEQLTYQNAVISSFVNCAVKEGFTGIDLNAIFQKLSIESGFRPQYASGNGAGIGQLTSIFVEDVHQKHRGYKYMKRIAESKTSDCDAAKMIAKPDLDHKPRFSDKCAFTSVGEGFERNVLYSLIGTTTVWEASLEPKLRPYLKKHAKDSNIEEVKKLTVMNAYGSAGPAGAAAAIRRLSAYPPSDFARLMKKPLMTRSGRNLTQYTSNIEKRQNVIGKNLTGDLKKDFANSGAAACLNPY